MTDTTRRPAFKFVKNDGLQYHFFAGGMAFSVRLVYRPSFCVHAGWIFENGQINEISKSTQVWSQSESAFLDISSDIMDIRDEDGEIVIVARRNDGSEGFTARVRPVNVLAWKDTFAASENDEVLHLPDLKGTLEYKGKTMPTRGYCKHVLWREAPRYTGYRFLHGILDDEDIAIWTADAVFGYKKYDYFKMIETDGSLVVADDELSSHKQSNIYARIGDRNIRVAFEELATWQLPLVDSTIDMVIQQRYGRITYHEGDVVKTGVAVTEYGFGKFGDSKLPE
ncbi:hypothetical protein M3P21_21485 [Ruegeria sp. 2012CJ41-6]|uniref:Uncharacterized protein n=1 Tax=Ruegeria spongiae TaxID=2942209 RepID=A0ABT0Q8G2_9RHOB|nr:hypothetical protein [Ruegeria spongiae]MCL6286087.1 hypothetical protein [Ruegeria spongiae]